MPSIITRGSFSGKAFGLTSLTATPVYVEDVFSTYLYTGNGSTQTITNGIDLAPATGPWTLYSASVGTGSGYQSLDVDSSGNMYISIAGSGFGYLAKLNSTGTVTWSKSFTSATEVHGVKCDSSGNVYVTFITEPAGGRTPQIFKYDSSGTLQWKKLISPLSTIGNRQYGIDVDGSGNVASAGNGFQNGGAQTPGTQILLTSSGTASWLKCVLGTGTYPHAFQYGARFDSSGNIIFSGQYNTAAGGASNLSKYNSAGTIQWNKMLAFASVASSFYSNVIDASNNIYAAGDSNSLGLLCKFDSTGALTWQLASTSTGFNSIALHSSGDLFVSSDSGDVMRVTNAGAIVWKVKFFGGSGSFPLACTTTDLYVKVNNTSIAKLPVDGSAQAGTLNGVTLGSSSTTFSAASGTLSNVTYGTGNTLTLSNSSVVEAAGSVTTTSYNQAAKTASNGLVWLKGRSGATDHALYDTARGATFDLVSNNRTAQTTQSTGLTVFGTTGFTIGSLAKINTSSATYVSWSFREQPKFFDVVTYTGNGANRTIAHNLGSVPGMIIVKRSNDLSGWSVYHKNLTSAAYYIQLDVDNAQAIDATIWNSTSPTSTVFSVGTNSGVNASGGTYVAYLFADQAGGFGLSGSDSVVSCGSFTGNTTVNLGWEPQYILLKASNVAEGWQLHDTMRGWPVSGDAKRLYANSNAAEDATAQIFPNAAGFSTIIGGSTYIYMAIRRGPMKTPTDATKVFAPVVSSAAAGTYQTTSFPVDSQWDGKRTSDALNITTNDRLRGVSTTSTASGVYLTTSATNAEATTNATTQAWDNTGFAVPTYYGSASSIYWNFRRAPGFFDEVCYTGTGVATTQAHNLGVVPELIIVKPRNRTGIYATGWGVYSAATGVSNALSLNETTPSQSVGTSFWNSTTPTSSVFSIGTNDTVNALNNGNLYVAYLFATCPGVSKVGSYTGTGAAQNIPCGFSGGTRFVLIKRTDSTGDWYVYDSARGISSGNDPYLLLNSTAAEVTGTNYVDTYSAGFTLTSSAPAGLNANGGSYIFLAIA